MPRPLRVPRSLRVPRVPAIVLAAGGSTRMGRPKALVEIGGRTALERVVEACRKGGCSPVFVVVGSDAEAVGAAARAAGAEVVENGAWARGRSTSVKAALPHLPAGVPGVVVFPVDHPLVEYGVVLDLLDSAGGHSTATVLLPKFQGRRGHPVYFSAEVFPEIAALGDDEPLRTVVHRAREVLELVVTGDAVLRNIDRPEDLPAS